MSEAVFTTTELVAGTSSVLQANGYKPVRGGLVKEPFANTRVFEDPYSVVAVSAFETWGDLRDGWLDAQAVLVELLSEHFERNEPKAWEGYLVLLTPDLLPRGEFRMAWDIRSNTAYVRKLVITGDDLHSVTDIEHSLRPVLPLQPESPIEEPASALDLLPDAMERRGIPRDASAAAIEAFTAQEPIAERLHAWIRRDDDSP
jgi:hypothetical protein